MESVEKKIEILCEYRFPDYSSIKPEVVDGKRAMRIPTPQNPTSYAEIFSKGRAISEQEQAAILAQVDAYKAELISKSQVELTELVNEVLAKQWRERHCTIAEASELISQKIHPDDGYDWTTEIRADCKREYLPHLKGLVLSGRIAFINPHTRNKFDHTILTDTRFPSDGLIEQSRLYACLLQKHEGKGYFPKPVSKAPPPIIPISLSSVPSSPPTPEIYKCAKPKWENWMPPGTMVRLWEGVCLAVDIEPPRPFGKEIWSLFELRRLNLPDKFYAAWEVLNRDQGFVGLEEVGTAGRMLYTINLDNFAYWASYKGFDLPPQMHDLATRSGMAKEAAENLKLRDNAEKIAESPAREGKLFRIKPQGGDSLTPMIWEICHDIRDGGEKPTPVPVMAQLKIRADSTDPKVKGPLLCSVMGGVKYEHSSGDERELDSPKLQARINEWKKANS
jgi:hypothetical protein